MLGFIVWPTGHYDVGAQAYKDPLHSITSSHCNDTDIPDSRWGRRLARRLRSWKISHRLELLVLVFHVVDVDLMKRTVGEASLKHPPGRIGVNMYLDCVFVSHDQH